MYWNRLFTAGLLILATATVAVSEQQFTVKGVLRDPAGRTVDDGAYKLTFDLYNVEEGGASLWNEIHPSVTVQHGVFGIVAGEITPLTGLGFQEIYYLGITVEDHPQLEPRLKLAPTPYALGTIGSDNFFPSTGAAGIGEKAPVSKLDIDGNLTIGSTYAGASAAPADGIAVEGAVGVGEAAPASKVGIAGNLSVGSTYAGANAAPADGALFEGNVGMGTTAPTEQLEVSGNAKVVGGNVKIQTTASGGNGFLSFYDVSGALKSTLYQHETHLLRLSDDTGADKVVVDGDGDLGVGLLLPVNKLGVEGGAAVGAGYAGTSTAPTNGAIIEGDVGIGTAAPTEKLHVAGNAKVTGAIIFSDNSSLNSANLGGSASSLAATGSAIVTSDSDENGTGDVELKTGSTTRMTITNGGITQFPVGEGLHLLGLDPDPNTNRDTRILRIHDVNDATSGFPDGDLLIEGYTAADDTRSPFLSVRGANGYLGVGTNSPGWPFHLVRNVAGRTQLMGLENTSGNVGDGASLLFLANGGSNATGAIGSSRVRIRYSSRISRPVRC